MLAKLAALESIDAIGNVQDARVRAHRIEQRAHAIDVRLARAAQLRLLDRIDPRAVERGEALHDGLVGERRVRLRRRRLRRREDGHAEAGGAAALVVLAARLDAAHVVMGRAARGALAERVRRGVEGARGEVASAHGGCARTRGSAMRRRAARAARGGDSVLRGEGEVEAVRRLDQPIVRLLIIIGTGLSRFRVFHAVGGALENLGRVGARAKPGDEDLQTSMERRAPNAA